MPTETTPSKIPQKKSYQVVAGCRKKCCRSDVTGIGKRQPSRASHSPPSRLNPYKVQAWFAFLLLQGIKVLSILEFCSFDISVAAFAGRIKTSHIFISI